MQRGKLIIFLTITSIAILATVAVFGINASIMNHGQGMGNTMNFCPLMNGMAICRMNIMEHISQWQQTFATAIPSSFSLAVLIMMGFISLLFLARDNLGNRSQLNQEIAFAQINRGSSQIIDYLSFAFSQGILHPKIYALSR